MGIFNLIKNLFKKVPSDRILTSLDADKEESQKVKELMELVRSYESQLSHIMAQRRGKKIEQIDKEDDITLIKKLDKENERLKNQNYEGSYDFMFLFRRLIKDKKFAKKLEICDKDDNIVFDKFKTFRILNDGSLAIQGMSGTIWSEGSSLNYVIWKPETLRNQIRRGRILIPYDSEMNPVIDIENEEIEEMSLDPKDDKWNISEERMKKIKVSIREKDSIINNLKIDKKYHEQTISDMRNKIQDLELAKNKWKNNAENSQSELSVAMQGHNEILKKLGQLDRDLVISQDQKQLIEQMKEKIEEKFKKVLDKLTNKDSQEAIENARDEYESMIQFVTDNLVIKT